MDKINNQKQSDSITIIIIYRKQLIKEEVSSIDKYFVFQLPCCESQWKAISDGFNRRWNYPHCIGAVDGKHIKILRPENAVAEFHNYKGTESIVTRCR